MGHRQIWAVTVSVILLLQVVSFGGSINPQQAEAYKRTQAATIPDWIKNNAKWWSDGQIGDSDFVSGIQFMIKENIISIPDLPEAVEGGGGQVPDWVRNNAGWWADGLISDGDFVRGLQFLVENGIIKV